MNRGFGLRGTIFLTPEAFVLRKASPRLGEAFCSQSRKSVDGRRGTGDGRVQTDRVQDCTDGLRFVDVQQNLAQNLAYHVPSFVITAQ